MRCKYNERILSKFLDNELPDKLSAEIQAHIKTCGVCSERIYVLNTLKKALTSIPAIIESKNFDELFYARLEREIMSREKTTIYGEISDRLKIAIDALFLLKVPVFVRSTVAVAFLIFLAFTGILLSVPEKPSVNSIQGEAFLCKRGTNVWKELSENTIIDRGDLVKTAGFSTANISVADKYHLRLRSGTTIAIAKLTPKHRSGIFLVDLKTGELLIDVDKGFKGSRFQVDTQIAGVRSLGTKFKVSSEGHGGKTEVAVVEGSVSIESKDPQTPSSTPSQKVSVGSGMKVEVLPDSPISIPLPLLAKEWEQLTDLYMLGKKTRIALLISSDMNRVLELLAPCPIFITDEEPRIIPPLLEEAVYYIHQATEGNDNILHLKGISMLEQIVTTNPGAEYNVQLLLFIGAYYYYLESYEDAKNTFARVLKEYTAAPLASLAECAIAYTYENELDGKATAIRLYREIIGRYPTSPEADFAIEKLRQASLALQ